METRQRFFIIAGLIILFLLALAFWVGKDQAVQAQARYNYRGPMITHRSAIGGDGGAVPTATTNAINTAGYSYLDVYVDVTGGSWRISPLFWCSTASAFIESSGAAQTTLTTDYHYTLTVGSADYVYLQCDDTGSGSATVYVQGVNRY